MTDETAWQKSSFSGAEGENCVEISLHKGVIMVRESDDPDTVVTTSREKLKAFILGVKAGEFDHLI